MSEFGSWRNRSTGQIIHHTSSSVVNKAEGWERCDTAGQPLQQSWGAAPADMGIDTFLLGQQLGADPRFRKFLKWCFVFVASALCLFVLYAEVEAGWARLMKADIEANKGKPTVWSATVIKWSPAMLFHKDQTFQVGGPDAFVNGDVDGMKLDAFSNLTMRGNVTNSHLTAYQTLTVGNVSNSTLTAHRIVVTGNAVNVKKIVLRPLAK